MAQSHVVQAEDALNSSLHLPSVAPCPIPHVLFTVLHSIFLLQFKSYIIICIHIHLQTHVKVSLIFLKNNLLTL